MIVLRRLAVLALFAVLALPSPVRAGGLFLTDRGTRPMSRGFAFVAGADDPQALWYNPAGLAWSGQQVLLDATYTLFRGSYARVDSGGNQLPTVDVHTIPVPIPGIALSHPLSDELTIGVGVFAPNVLLLDYNDYFDETGQRCNPNDGNIYCVAPQRYSLLTMKGGVLAEVAGAVAWRPIPNLSIGVGLHGILGTFRAQTTLTGCDGAICTQNENPTWDGVAQLRLPVINFAPVAGLTYDAGPIRLATSFIWWPRGITGVGHMDVRIPSSALFAGATVDGDRAKVTVALPFQLRAGVEVRPVDRLRMEAAVVYERWSRQEAITIAPRDVWIRDLVAIGDYQVGKVSVPRNMNDVWSLRFGGSVAVLEQRNLVLSGGVNYENSSFDNAYLTALTLDARKIIATGGISLRLGDAIWIDATYAHVFMNDPNVTNSAVTQPNAIRPPQAPEITAYVGNGRYRMEADIFGVGLRWQIDEGATPASAEEPEEELEVENEPPQSETVAPAMVVDAPAAVSPAEEPVAEEPSAEESETEPTPRRRGRSARPRRTSSDPNPYR